MPCSTPPDLPRPGRTLATAWFCRTKWRAAGTCGTSTSSARASARPCATFWPFARSGRKFTIRCRCTCRTRWTGLALLEARRNLLGIPRQQAYVAAYSYKVVAHLEERLHVVQAACQHAGGLACGANTPGCVLQSGLHIGLLRISKMAEIRCQIAWTDEDAVDAFNFGDALDLSQCSAGFNLHQHAGVLMRVLVVVLDAPVVVGARSDGNSANTKRRITCGGDCMKSFIDTLHERNEQRARANIHCALDDHHVIPRHAEDRRGSAATHGL